MEDSFGTMVNYTHYRIDLPNMDIQWTKERKLLHKCLTPYPDQILLRKRFVVFEELCSVDARLKAR